MTLKGQMVLDTRLAAGSVGTYDLDWRHRRPTPQHAVNEFKPTLPKRHRDRLGFRLPKRDVTQSSLGETTRKRRNQNDSESSSTSTKIRRGIRDHQPPTRVPPLWGRRNERELLKHSATTRLAWERVSSWNAKTTLTQPRRQQDPLLQHQIQVRSDDVA